MFFLGHDAEYWLELDRQSKLGGMENLLEELIKTRKALWQAEGMLRHIQELLLDARPN